MRVSITWGAHMTDYRIKVTGSSFIVAADGHDVLRCADENIARQIVRDAKAGRCTNSCTSSIGASTAGLRRPLPKALEDRAFRR